jgi:hypothetical protein
MRTFRSCPPTLRRPQRRCRQVDVCTWRSMDIQVSLSKCPCRGGLSSTVSLLLSRQPS